MFFFIFHYEPARMLLLRELLLYDQEILVYFKCLAFIHNWTIHLEHTVFETGHTQLRSPEAVGFSVNYGG